MGDDSTNGGNVTRRVVKGCLGRRMEGKRRLKNDYRKHDDILKWMEVSIKQ